MHHHNIQRRSFSIRLLTLFAGSGFALNTLAKASAAASVLLAKSAPANIDPAGYLVSEKLDGVRALWDGKALRFRSGRLIAVPAWFSAKLPTTPLDGELWIARGQFDALSGTVRKIKPVDAEWQKVNYMVFELPAGSGDFKDRALALDSIVNTAAWPQLQAIEQTAIANRATLQAKLDDVVQGGGEGLMLHLASAPVATGRSDALLKLKPVQDAEATVVGYVAGKGKYALIEMPLFEIPVYASTVFFDLLAHGVTPVWAHPERCYEVIDDYKVVYPYRDNGVLLQINAGSLLGMYGKKVRHTAAVLLKNGCGHIVASDVHKVKDVKTLLPEGFSHLVKMVGNAKAVDMVLSAPAKVIHDS